MHTFLHAFFIFFLLAIPATPPLICGGGGVGEPYHYNQQWSEDKSYKQALCDF